MTHTRQDLNTREYFDKRMGAMRLERGTFIPHWKELSEFVQPRRGRFTITDANKGDARFKAIINSQAGQALRTARSGFFSGTMSPSQPWFKFVFMDPAIREIPEVKEWLEIVEKILFTIFAQGNLYTMAPVMLGELLLFGTGCMLHVEDFADVARFYTQTVGSYMISQNDRFVVDTVAREFERTTSQLVAEFGLDNVLQTTRASWDRGDYDQRWPVAQFIEPNPSMRDGGVFGEHKPFRSVHYQHGDDKKFLGIKGFEEFPAYAPRWEVTGEDIYGTDCPGMTALGDVKGLQLEERRKAQGIDKMVNPPLHGPAGLKNVPTSSLPGGLTTYDTTGTHVLRPIHEVKPRLGELMDDIRKTEARIDTAFYSDLFRAITNMEGIQPRNQEELLQRNAERLQELGPVLQRVHGEFLAKMVDRQLNMAARAGILPPAPDIIKGKSMDVRFISSLAVAQRAVAAGGIERIAAFTGGLIAAGWEEAGDKLDADQMIDEFGQAIGVPARITVPDDRVQKKREKREAQLEAQQLQAAAKDIIPAATGAAAEANRANEAAQ